MLHFPPWKIWSIVAVLVLGAVFAVPNLLTREESDRLPSWLPHQRITLGLDLQGGSHLLFEVGVGTLIKERLTGVVDSVRVELRKANIGYTSLGVDGDSAVVKLRDPGSADTAQPLLRKLAHLPFDRLEIFWDKWTIDDEVVEKTFVGRRADAALRTRKQVGHRCRHQVRADWPARAAAWSCRSHWDRSARPFLRMRPRDRRSATRRPARN